MSTFMACSRFIHLKSASHSCHYIKCFFCPRLLVPGGVMHYMVAKMLRRGFICRCSIIAAWYQLIGLINIQCFATRFVLDISRKVCLSMLTLCDYSLLYINPLQASIFTGIYDSKIPCFTYGLLMCPLIGIGLSL